MEGFDRNMRTSAGIFLSYYAEGLREQSLQEEGRTPFTAEDPEYTVPGLGFGIPWGAGVVQVFCPMNRGPQNKPQRIIVCMSGDAKVAPNLRPS